MIQDILRLLSQSSPLQGDARTVADLVAALSLHVGEVARNPYHLSLPAWMQDNVRRGSELVGGQGGRAPEFTFATLYRLSHWENRKLVRILEKGLMLGMKDDLLIGILSAGLRLNLRRRLFERSLFQTTSTTLKIS
jgi:hypothetical protein